MTRLAFPAHVESCRIAQRDPHEETSEHVLEVAVYWHDDLLSVRHVTPACGVRLPEVGAVALSLPFHVGMTTETRAGAVTVRATRVYASRRIPRSGVDLRGAASMLLAAGAHAIALGALALCAPAAGRATEVTVDDLDLMRSYLASSDGISHTPKDGLDDAGHGDQQSGAPGGTGTRAEDDEGRMGLRTSSRNDAHYATSRRWIEGDLPDERPISVEDARAFGVIGLLAQPDASTDGTFAWASASREVNGAMWGSLTDDAFGNGGLWLSGVGQGGGGAGTGIGLGTIGTIGRGSGIGRGEDSGPGGAGGTCDDTCVAGQIGHGHGSGRLTLAGRRTSTIVCHLSIEEARVNGRLPPEVIQRIVHQSFGRFRGCYEQGLARSPSLAGRVATKFVIARDGSVSAAADAGSDLPDASVVACVQRTFEALSFPEPTGGVVSVVYPITFSPE